MADFRQIALLIDADNTQLSKLKAIVYHLSQRGRICVRRAFANWSLPQFRVWDKLVNMLGIQAEQHFQRTNQKNASDIALVISAMDLLYRTNCDAYAIVSSDSDFTPLALRLREAGVYVIGYGKGNRMTPESFRNSCNEFFCIDDFEPELPATPAEPPATPAASCDLATPPPGASTSPEPPAPPAQPAPSSPAPAPSAPPSLPPLVPAAPPAPLLVDVDEAALHQALQDVAASKPVTDRFLLLTEAGIYIHEQYPGARLRYAGHNKLRAFLEAHRERYELKLTGKEPNRIIHYRCLENGAPLPSVPLARVHLWLRRIAERFNAADGYVCIGRAGAYINRQAEEEGRVFNVKQYGHPTLTRFLRAFPKLYEVREEKHEGTTIIFYKSRSACQPVEGVGQGERA